MPARHPTCSNFRSGSAMIIARWLRLLRKGACICEVGAGKSLVAEQLLHDGRSLDHQLLITDQSARMLQYSRQFEAAGAKLRVADAEKLPLDSGSMDCLVSSLGDPYNNAAFWTEASRVLKGGGTLIFTVPAYDWARRFRKGAGTTDFERAEFELADGRRVFLPSFIYSKPQQQVLIEKTGLTVGDIHDITLGDLANEELSPKLCVDRGPQGAVVTGYFVQKSLAGGDNAG
jgi:SAM-dependent methyltransferase